MRCCLSWIATGLLSVPAVAAATHYPITTEQVAAAIADSGLQTTAADITLPGSVFAFSPTPTLRIRSAQPMPDHSTVVRVECEGSGECLPFYAKVRKASGKSNGVPQKELRNSHAALVETKSPRLGPAVHSGDQAVLRLEGDHVRIDIPVVCIESGDRGSRIRVRSAANRQVYTAEVIDVAILKGSL